VTLEPCSSEGRTGPCTEAILRAGVARVSVCCRDPNPRHAGRGLALLADAGIAVREGLCEGEGQALLRPFAQWITTGRPYVTLKLGMSLDGRIADHAGKSQWITSAASRDRVQALRRRVDAILVGVETVLHDDPSLRPRPADGRDPLRVIVDSRGRMPVSARVLTDAHAGRTVIAVTEACPAAQQAAYADRGARVLVLPARGGRVSLKALMKAMGRLEVLHLLCEGGGEVAGSLLEQELADEVWAFIAPCLLGGAGRPAVAGRGWHLDRMPRACFAAVEKVGSDVFLRMDLSANEKELMLCSAE
jgi:diaminohydroxyphosphoribosylaminopyrimidine deaminase / 5-amino-6-(5-phosphoribosylamino)uracil reductase